MTITRIRETSILLILQSYIHMNSRRCLSYCYCYRPCALQMFFDPSTTFTTTVPTAVPYSRSLITYYCYISWTGGLQFLQYYEPTMLFVVCITFLGPQPPHHNPRSTQPPCLSCYPPSPPFSHPPFPTPLFLSPCPYIQPLQEPTYPNPTIVPHFFPLLLRMFPRLPPSRLLALALVLPP